MKEILKNKRLVAAVAVVLVAVLSVVIAVSVKGNKVETAPENSQPNTSDVSNSIESTEKETEKESTEKDAEKVTEKNETTTKKEVETTSNNKKPSANKKPTANKKPSSSKAPTTTKKAEPTKSDEEIELEMNRYLLYQQYDGEAGYKAHLEEIKNEKCPGCGKVGCPSQKYEKNALGDIDSIHYESWKCPAIIAEKVTCKYCGKIIVAGPDGYEKLDKHPEKYCLGNCYISF